MSESELKQQIFDHYKENEGETSDTFIKSIRTQAENNGFTTEKIDKIFKEAFKEFEDEHYRRTGTVLDHVVGIPVVPSEPEKIEPTIITKPDEIEIPPKPVILPPKADHTWLIVGVLSFIVVVGVMAYFLTQPTICPVESKLSKSDLSKRYQGYYEGDLLDLKIEKSANGDFVYGLRNSDKKYTCKIDTIAQKIQFYQLEEALGISTKDSLFGMAQYSKILSDTILLKFSNFELKH